MTGMQRLQERMAEAQRLSDLYRAEYNGLVRATYSPHSMPFAPTDPDMQRRFDLGLREGREILNIHEALAAASTTPAPK